MQIIAHIHTEFSEKFGIPRQSGLAQTVGKIIFTPPYRNADALRGIEDYSHLWLLWEFSEAIRDTWSPTVRPPRLGGNTRMGVFATRSPFRPNPIGLSSVRLLAVDLHTPDGPTVTVQGADLMDGTPIYDIKPYLAFTDSHPDAVGGFADAVRDTVLQVQWNIAPPADMPDAQKDVLDSCLAQDPRPSYQNDPDRVYTFSFMQWEVSFSVSDTILYVQDVRSK